MARRERVNVGDMSFVVKGVSVLRPRVTGSFTLITAIPIIVRIPRENYERYGIKPPKDYAYLYWRKNYPSFSRGQGL